MIQITVNVGTELRGDALPLTERERAEGVHAIEQEAIRAFGGFTTTRTFGAWANGPTMHEEQGMQLEILTTRALKDNTGADGNVRSDAKAFAAFCRDALKQQCVLLRVAEVQGEFV